MLDGLEYASYVIATYSATNVTAGAGAFAGADQLKKVLVRLSNDYGHYSPHSAGKDPQEFMILRIVLELPLLFLPHG